MSWPPAAPDRSGNWPSATALLVVMSGALFGRGALLDVGADPRGRGGIGVPFEIHQSVPPSNARPGRRERLAGTLAPVGPQGPPAHRAAGLVAVAARWCGSLLWTTGTSCVCACNRRSFTKETACHNRAPSRQSSGTKHLRREGGNGNAAVASVSCRASVLLSSSAC